MLPKHTRYFAHTQEHSAPLFDLLTDQFLDVFDRLWGEGLLKSYEQRLRISSSPIGRIKPFESTWRTARAGTPVAVSTAFHRTPNTGPNRVLKLALERLLARHLPFAGQENGRSRLVRLRRAISRLDGVGQPNSRDMSPASLATTIARLAEHHEHYADALRLAQIIIADLGLMLRGTRGVAVLPSILINMAVVFENYARRILSDALAPDGVRVLDGNLGFPHGAMEVLFEDREEGESNPPVKPDIIIKRDDDVSLVIDAKYKPPAKLPERSETEQAVCYGARYNCEKVMLLYAGRSAKHRPIERIGRIGRHTVFMGRIDLGAEDIQAEEASFVKAIQGVL